ncbi:hypothetical protein EB796_001035 [Bugula neritina]|uniref:Uncharacterized protein n=1 Tax=Bugula neritina TaxID=10212 RepID=A0A7J7KR28_BUGNE|nr:hypothetical protein EB796_001035 [Bugula neritina]
MLNQWYFKVILLTITSCVKAEEYISPPEWRGLSTMSYDDISSFVRTPSIITHMSLTALTELAFYSILQRIFCIVVMAV